MKIHFILYPNYIQKVSNENTENENAQQES